MSLVREDLGRMHYEAAWDLQKPADAQAGITSLLLRAMQPVD